ncbi:unnamed protein product, partial [Prorocentrum cordatum]
MAGLAYGLAPVVRDWAATGLYAANLWTSLRRDRHCTCSFTGKHDRELLQVLQRQLDRCGPEQLRSAPLECPSSFWEIASVLCLAVGAAFIIGFLVGRFHGHGPAKGDKLYCLRSLEDRRFHERLLCGHVDGSRLEVATPDADVYADDFADENHVEIHRAGPRGGVPHQLRKKMLYQLGLDEQARAALLADAGGGPLPPVQLDDDWVALESRRGFRRGSSVGVTFAFVYALDDRDRASFMEEVIVLERVETLSEEAPPAPRDALGDVPDERILRYWRGGAVQRRHAFSEVAAEQREVLRTQEWRVQGPATIDWLLQAHLEQGSGLVQRHYWWRQIRGLAAADPGIDAHLLLCGLIETAPTADQLNLPGCEASELAARRFQLWDEVYSEALRQVEVSSMAGATDGWLDARRIVLSGSRSKGHALVAPPLEAHVVEKMQEEGAILKERRQGREERRMGRAATAVVMAASAQGVSDTGIARDVLPLPLGVALDELLHGAAARLLPHGGGRRGRQRRQQEVWLREGIAALNDLGGRGMDAPAGVPAARQVTAVRRLAQLYGRVEPPPSDLTPLGAWQTLQASWNGYADVMAEGASTTYRKGAMALPRAAAGRVRLADVLPPHLQSLLCNSSQMLREPEARNFALGEAPRVCAMGPVLQRHGYQYGECLSELLSAGIIEPAAEDSIIERAGIFFVPKKALANLEVNAAGGIAVASGDVECCFYQYELPPWARAFFGLPAVQARFLDSAARQRLGVSDSSEMIHFVARVVPMGWSWAVHLIQEAHAHVLSSISPDAPWIADKAPAPAPGTQCATAKMLYIDNVAVFASGSGDPALEVERMLAALGARGIQASFDRDDGGMHALLGFVLHKPSATWRLSHSKFWRLKFSLDFALAPGRLVTGRELERLMGHITAAVMLQRHMLSLFHAIYEFCRRSRDKRQPLWSSVKRELTWFRALLPCVTVSLSRPWCERVTAADASPWGFGVVEQPWPISDVRRVGSLSERSRFRGVPTADYAPRDTLVEQQLLHATADEVTAEGTLTHFEEVPAARLLADPWSVAAARRWRRAAAIHVLEAEGARWAVRRLARNSQLHGHRHLVLGDNLGVVCACEKGRAAHFALNVVCREICAISVASGMQLRRSAHITLGLCPETSARGNATMPATIYSVIPAYGKRARDAAEPKPAPTTRRASDWRGGHGPPGPSGSRRGWTSHAPLSDRPAEGCARRVPLCRRRSRLAARWVQHITVRSYLLVLIMRSGSPRLLALPGWIPAQSDETLVDYPEWAFDRGTGQEASSRTHCAVAGGAPALGRPARRRHPPVNASLSGGAQRPSGHSRQPLPRAPARALAAVLASREKPDPGRCVLVAYDRGLTASSRTGEFDSTVGPDIHRRHWIGRAVAPLQLLRLGEKLLCVSSHLQCLADFHVACQYLKLKGLDCSPHFRGSGDATRVCVAGYRAPLEVRRRETWRATLPAQRYDKANWRAVVKQALSSAQRRSCEIRAVAAPQLFVIAYVPPSAPDALPRNGAKDGNYGGSVAAPGGHALPKRGCPRPRQSARILSQPAADANCKGRDAISIRWRLELSAARVAKCTRVDNGMGAPADDDDNDLPPWDRAILMCTLLKLFAACGQYMIGYTMGWSVKVQQLVGVDKVQIKAIEMILQTKGLNSPKVACFGSTAVGSLKGLDLALLLALVAVLLGGPDWPTSVLCGILRISIPQMLLGTLPIVLLCAPSVLYGAFLITPVEDEDDAEGRALWETLSGIMLMGSALSQLFAVCLALYFLQDKAFRHYEYLAQPRPEHAKIIELTQSEAAYNDAYDRVTHWRRLPLWLKIMIQVAVSCMILQGMVLTLAGSLCFRPFGVNNKISDPWDK